MLAGAALGALMFASPSQAQEMKELNIMLPNTNTTTLYPHIVARDTGMYEDAGLKVNLLDADTTVPYVAFLSNSQADAVMLDAPQTFQAVNEKLPIKVVYEAMQNAPEVLSVVVDGPIKTLDDLKGKTIGMASDRDLVTASIVLGSAGISIDEVSTVVVSDQGPVVAKAIQDDAIQAYAAGINDTTVLAAFGIVMQDLTPADIKINPANTFSVWGPRLDEIRPDLEKFFRVWAMATRAGKLDRDTVATMSKAAVPEEWENEGAGQALMDAAVSLNYSTTEKFGDVQPGVWASIQPNYIKYEQIDAEVDPATFLDGSLIDAANNFTDADVQAYLDKWKAANP
jgi:ABC-type nitrate/sulfonate/bicarbonate transport system substrate-binding protein